MNWGNKEAVLEQVSRDGMALEHASPELRDDREVVLAAIGSSGGAVQWASSRLRDDSEVMTAAVNVFPWSLEWASERLRADRELVLGAITIYSEVFQYASMGLQEDRDFVMVALRRNGWVMKFVSDKFKDDMGLALAAVDGESGEKVGNVAALQHMSQRLRSDRELGMHAVKKSGWALQYLSNELRSDKRLVLEAVFGAVGSQKHARGEALEICGCLGRDGALAALKKSIMEDDAARQKEGVSERLGQDGVGVRKKIKV